MPVSTIGFGFCPFLIIIIGSPLLPDFDQLFWINVSSLLLFTLLSIVLPNLIEFPHLPSTITSPAKGSRGFTVVLGTKVPPISGEL